MDLAFAQGVRAALVEMLASRAGLGSSIESVSLAGCFGVGPNGFAPLSQLTLLDKLDLSFVAVNDKSLLSIGRGCRRLRHVALAGTSGFKGATLHTCVGRFWRNLRDLNVAHIDSPDKGMMLRDARQARSLARDDAVVTIKLFEALRNCGGLERIVARGNPFVDDTCIKVLTENKPWLRYIDVSDGPAVGLASFLPSVSRCGQLAAFICDDREATSSQITTEGLKLRFKDLERVSPPDLPFEAEDSCADQFDEDESDGSSASTALLENGATRSAGRARQQSAPAALFRKLSQKLL